MPGGGLPATESAVADRSLPAVIVMESYGRAGSPEEEKPGDEQDLRESRRAI